MDRNQSANALFESLHKAATNSSIAELVRRSVVPEMGSMLKSLECSAGLLGAVESAAARNRNLIAAATKSQPTWLSIAEKISKQHIAYDPGTTAKLLDSVIGRQAAFTRLPKSLALPQLDLTSLTGSIALQEAERKRFLAALDFENIVKAADKFRQSLDGVTASATLSREVEGLFKTISDSQSLSSLRWKDVLPSLADAARAMESPAVQGPVSEALQQVAAEESDLAAALVDFARKIFSSLDFWTALTVVLTLVQIAQNAYQPYYDYYVKETLSAKADAENRRALAKEISNEFSKIDFGSAYVATRRVVMKQMTVRLNPKMNSPRIGDVKMGELVVIVKADGDWTCITWRNSQGKEFVGWVLARYLQPLR